MYENILSLDELDNHGNPKLTYHFINSKTGWEWWVCAGEQLENSDYYFFGVAKIFEKEIGFFCLTEILKSGAELDTEWEDDIGLYDIL